MQSRTLTLLGCCLGMVIAAAVVALVVRAGNGQGRVAPLSVPALNALGSSRLTPRPPVSLPTTGAPNANPPAPIPLTSGWQYVADPTNVGLGSGWTQGTDASLRWQAISIPNDFNPVVSTASDRGTQGWYRLRFAGPPALAGRSWDVHFGEVRRHADVWLNGTLIGRSVDPYAPFSLPATGLRPGASNVLVVRVDNVRGPGTFPQDWWNWGGITQPVTLEPVGRVALDDLGVMPELGCDHRCGDLIVQGTLRNLAPTALAPVVLVKWRSPGGLGGTWRHTEPSIASGATVPVSFRVPIHGRPDLWAPGHPALYRVGVATRVRGRVEQRDSLRVGLRSVQVRHGIIYLNGRRAWLHGASIQEDVAGRGAALTDADIDTIVDQLRSVGANVTRAHYLLSPRLLDALDAAGILVWSQPPVDHADANLRTAIGRTQALQMLRATLIGERSHPSVIVDSVANELAPSPETTPGTLSYLQQAIPVTRSLDPAALVGLDVYGYPGFPRQKIYSALDVIGISDYFGWYPGIAGHSISDFARLMPYLRQMHARYPNQGLVIGEYGAEGLFNGPAATKGTYAFQSDYLRRTFGVLDQLPFMNGAIYWTLREFAVSLGWTGGAALPAGATPDGLHHKGLIDYDGAEKPAFAVARQLFATRPPYVH